MIGGLSGHVVLCEVQEEDLHRHYLIYHLQTKQRCNPPLYCFIQYVEIARSID